MNTEVYLVVRGSDNVTVAVCTTDDKAQMQCAVERKAKPDDNFTVYPMLALESIADEGALVKRWVVSVGSVNIPSLKFVSKVCEPQQEGYMYRLSGRVKFKVYPEMVKLFAEDTSPERCLRAIEDAMKALESLVVSNRHINEASLYMQLGAVRARDGGDLSSFTGAPMNPRGKSC